MLQSLRSRPSKVGLPPGAAVFTGTRRAERALLRLTLYGPETLEELEDAGLDDVARHARAPEVTWVDVVGLHDVDLVKGVCDAFGIHPLTLEDILHPHSRSKFEDFGDYLTMTLRQVRVRTSGGREPHLDLEHLVLVLGRGFVLPFQEVREDPFDPVRERLRSAAGRLRRKKEDYLAYALLDAVVDEYFLAVEALGLRVEELEDRLLDRVVEGQHLEIHTLRRLLLLLRKVAFPLREIVPALQRADVGVVRKETQPFLRDVLDHVLQVLDDVELYRAMTDGLVDMYASGMTNRTNRAIMVLSVFGAVFLPLTFIAGVYGMNFEHMPELHWRWAYPGVLTVMFGVALGLILTFRRWRWL